MPSEMTKKSNSPDTSARPDASAPGRTPLEAKGAAGRGRRQAPAEMTFVEHLDALRPHLMRSAAVLLLLVVVAFCCKRLLVDTVLFGPMSQWFPTNRLLDRLGLLAGLETPFADPEAFRLVNTTMAGQFNLHLQISVAAAFALGFPYLLWELWRFVRPALTERELRGSRRFVLLISAGFFAGLAFGYFLIAPLTVGFLSQYRVSEAVSNLIDAGSYLATVLNVSLACAVVFQLPLLVGFLTRMGLVSPALLRRYRRHALVALAALAALITPPDVFSMLLVLLPLYGLYEFGIRVSERTRSRARQRYFSGESGSRDITR